MTLRPVESSNIKALGYDAKAQKLDVEFHGSGTYRYSGVPPVIYRKILRNKSKGKSLHRLVIKAGLPYEKIANLGRIESEAPMFDNSFRRGFFAELSTLGVMQKFADGLVQTPRASDLRDMNSPLAGSAPRIPKPPQSGSGGMSQGVPKIRDMASPPAMPKPNTPSLSSSPAGGAPKRFSPMGMPKAANEVMPKKSGAALRAPHSEPLANEEEAKVTQDQVAHFGAGDGIDSGSDLDEAGHGKGLKGKAKPKAKTQKAPPHRALGHDL
jgi:hypothetical protein